MKFNVSGHITISVSCEVEAESIEEATEKASELDNQGLCCGCASQDPQEYWVTGGELDGEVQIVGVEKGE